MVVKSVHHQQQQCVRILNSSDTYKVYISFHDEQWGVPVYDDNSFMWGYVSYKATINKYKYPRNVPLRTPKAEAISKDLLKHGFRLVGPVIVYSFMQAAGLTIDHLVDCFRYNECLTLAERPWRHI
ncbi:hypothetical protein V6N12_043575 [Hibiscus sabdariffa]|uniref:Uncharacterized protein n=1 Tax=Hibiscus sabdariffa TaxID=183260 RepID=A0ABR2DEQ0_9ROSI